MNDRQRTKTQAEQPQAMADENPSGPPPHNSNGEQKSKSAGPSAFEELLQRDKEFFRIENKRLARLAKRLKLQAADMEDVIQEAWLCALEHRERFAAAEIEPRLHGWLKKATFYKGLNLLRRNGCRLCQSLSEPALEPSDDAATTSAATAELHEWLDALLAKASRGKEENLRLLRLRYFLGFASADLALQFHLTVKAVDGRLRRLRKQLADAAAGSDSGNGSAQPEMALNLVVIEGRKSG